MARTPSTDRPAADTPVTLAAWGATVAWLLISALVFFGMAGGEAGLDPLRVMMVPVAVFGPVALIWIAAFLTRRVSALTRAVDRLEQGGAGGDLSRRLDALARGQERLRAALGDPGPSERDGSPDAAPVAPDPAPAEKASAPARAATSGRASAATAPPADASASERAAPRPPAGQAAAAGDNPPPEPAPRLDLPGGAADRPLEPATLIAALQFPADASDEAGFHALRRAMRDPAAKPVVTAAQDLLTLLSEVDLYMDDVAPAPADAAVWRRFAAGERGAAVAGIGGAATPETEARVTERLRADPIFRDAAHHFVRLFDRLLADRAPDLSDEDLRALAATRSARAFALVGRSLGTFG